MNLAPSKLSSSHSDGPTSAAPARVLLVDDDPSFCKIMKRAAEKAGMDLTACSSIDELGARMHEPFDVAVLDYDLGSVTGIELAKYLENREWTLPVILISQSALPTNRKSPDAVTGFVHKELGPNAILNAVRKLR